MGNNEFHSELNQDDFTLNLSEEDIQKAEELKEELKAVDQEQKANDKVTQLEEEINEKNTKIRELEEAFLREHAEVENFKRRMREEQQQLLKYANQGLMTELLPVLDGFTHALASAEKTEATEAFFQGFEMIQKQLVTALTNAGLQEVELTGAFNPNGHQAIMTDCVDGYEDDEIIDTMMKGYTLHDRTLRAAMVKVNKK
ncbi:MAG: nucleotide exchange factor GrpE [Culicoidibacterales bacterium]